MATIDLNLLRPFTLVYELRSFSLAADRLGVPRSTVSRAISTLEEARNVELFHRTTRKVTPTEEGTALYDRTRPLLGGLVEALSEIPQRADAGVPTGLLRVTSTADLGALVLAEVVSRFVARYPEARVEARFTTELVDFARDGFDLALRVAPGRLKASSLVARRVGSVVFGLYASPSYLARRGTPRAPDDLAAHEWVGFVGTPPLLLKQGGLPKKVIGGVHRVMADDMGFLREALKHGAGIGTLPSFLADPEVAAGTLVRVVPKFFASAGTVYLVRPGLKIVPRRVTAFSDLLIELLRQRPLSPAP